MSKHKGGFTLPGEAGYEKLTLELAEKWGADVIRDSDGTVLSDEITNSGYGIYSTICIIREHNEWAKNNMDKLQQCFLSTDPKVMTEDSLNIPLMENFFSEQFTVNDTPEAMKFWQVYDRTTGIEVSRQNWTYDDSAGTVIVSGAKWHKYTVSFLAYRIWEEISMYNHTTNNWDKEHLMQIDPMYPETREYLKAWMENWCKEHPATTVVRFTSLFYNFVWIWGNSELNRHRFADWASYDFTVSVRALEEFQKKYGEISAEDFINKGNLYATHNVPGKKKLQWMEFINDFVISFGKELIDIVHKYGKKAYVFYDDSWVGMEPYNDRFQEFGFDGIIKCVFSGFEVRLCSGVKADTHEIRLHPYLFPVGLGGKPTFMEGGNPTADAKLYWRNVRRALLREPVDRIGLGGYLHLLKEFPDFIDYIEELSDEFRMIRDYHSNGKPLELKPRVAVLHAWGKLRSWTLSGHFHETYMHDLIHINESLSGLPLNVRFIDFEDIENGIPDDIDVIINAGYEGSAWSGGSLWRSNRIVENLTEWIYNGGGFIGINEPSATTGYDTVFRMAHALGVDIDKGQRACHGSFSYTADAKGLVPEGAEIDGKSGVFLCGKDTGVILESDGTPVITSNDFGSGTCVYMSSYKNTDTNTRLLLNLILHAVGVTANEPKDFICDNYYIECAYYPGSKKLVAVNNSESYASGKISAFGRTLEIALEGSASEVFDIGE